MAFENLNAVVKRDLRGGTLTDAEHQGLRANAQAWRACLLDQLQSCDAQFTSRRKDALKIGTTQARLDYESWKSSAVGYKLAIVNRMREVKDILRTQSGIEETDRIMVLDAVLVELRRIRTFMEKKWPE